MEQLRVTKLEADRRRSDWVWVHVEGGRPFKVPLAVAVELHVGQSLSATDLRRLQEAASVQRATEMALRYLAYRSRSTAEVRQYLRQKKVPDAIVEQVIARLTERGWLDDRAFARWWVENRSEHRPRGRLVLAAELRQKGVPEACIQEVLDELPEDETVLARRAAERFARRLVSVQDRETFVRRLSAHLSRRGFEWETIRQVVEALWAERHSEDGGDEF